jgi:predicted amidophosphoribosyltransferase
MATLAHALNIVFPQRCAGCGLGPWPFCAVCRSELRPLEPPWCARCGRPSLQPLTTCLDCPPEPLTSARAPFHYSGPVRSAIHRLKFSGWRDVGGALSGAMAALGLPPVDAITWVPLARPRLAERGYDQARALARGLAHELHAPTLRLLRRVVVTAPQARRGGAARRRAMQDAFASRGPAPPRVLLVDDVLTTGATAAACAEALTMAGAHEVHLAAAARSLSSPPPALPVAGRRAYPQTGPRPGLWLPGGDPR